MVKLTQVFNDYSSNSSLKYSADNSKSSNSISSDQSKKLFTNSNSNVSEKKGFTEVLNSKKQSKVSVKESTDKCKLNKEDKIKTEGKSIADEMKKRVDELKEKLDDSECDEKDVKDILSELLNILNTLMNQNETSENIKSNENDNFVNTLVSSLTSQNKDNNLLSSILETISSSESKTSLTSDVLKDVKGFLQQLSESLNEDSKVTFGKGISDVIDKLNDILKNSDNNGQTVTNAADLLKQNNSDDQSLMNDDSSQSNSNMANKKADSKEDKFLNSLLEDKKDAVDNKINVFATRTQAIQNQNSEVRGLTINKATFTDDLIKDVKYMSTNNLKELTVKVNPGNLGEITIKLVQEDGLMKANLKANSKETTALLSQNLAEIKKELGDQNIKISEVNIELYNEDTTFFKNESFGSQLSQEQENGRQYAHSGRSVNSESGVLGEDIQENLAMLDNNLDFLA